MKVYQLWGFECGDLQAARLRAEQALGISMVVHESLYRGEYYRSGDAGSENFILQKNVDPMDGEPVEPACEECGVLLYVNETDREAAVSAVLAASAKLIWRKEL
jgi:hypothetical protein